jgi:hypothetical protein
VYANRKFLVNPRQHRSANRHLCVRERNTIKRARAVEDSVWRAYGLWSHRGFFVIRIFHRHNAVTRENVILSFIKNAFSFGRARVYLIRPNARETKSETAAQTVNNNVTTCTTFPPRLGPPRPRGRQALLNQTTSTRVDSQQETVDGPNKLCYVRSAQRDHSFAGVFRSDCIPVRCWPCGQQQQQETTNGRSSPATVIPLQL